MQNYGALTGVAPSPMGANRSRVTASLTTLGYGAPTRGVEQVSAQAYNGPLAGTSLLGQPVVIWLGMFALLGLFKFLSEHPKTSISPAHIHIGGYNVAAIGVTSVVAIAAFKMIANRWPAPGITDLANFV